MSPQVIVTQLGARRHFAVPTAFFLRNKLQQFYTDFYLTHRLKQFLPKTFQSRLLRRHASALPDDCVTSFPVATYLDRLRNRTLKRSKSQSAYWIQTGRAFCLRVNACGLGDASAVYAYSSAALETFELARSLGKSCVLDHATAPRRLELDLVLQQVQRYPEWGNPTENDDAIDRYTERQRKEAFLADKIVCGSKFVQNMIHELWGLGDKCVVVPLAISNPPAKSLPRKPSQKLRILFIGDEAIRKGLADLNAAVRQLPNDTVEVRVLGEIDISQLARASLHPSMICLGRASKAELEEHFAWADVFVLPSVSDTFGIVVIEAMQHGVPAIVSSNTGAADVVEDGVNGFVIPPMNPTALYQRLSEVLENPERLAAMRQAIRENPLANTFDNYADRLAAIVSNL